MQFDSSLHVEDQERSKDFEDECDSDELLTDVQVKIYTNNMYLQVNI